MENYLVLNGRRVDLTEKQIEKLGLQINKNPFERTSMGENFYFIGSDGFVCWSFETNEFIMRDKYNAGNYCTDKELLKERAKEEVLNRLLWRFSMENGGNKIDWKNPNQSKYFIFQNTMADTWSISSRLYNKKNDSVYFISQEVAQRAIDEIIIPFYKGELEVCKIWER